MWSRTSIALFCVTMGSPSLLSAQTKQAPAPAASMSVALVRQIQQFGSTETVRPGIIEIKGDTIHLFITSARTLIASRTKEVHGEGGTYRPTAQARLDLVSVTCGSTELANQFHCARVSVRSASGVIVRASRYRAGPETVRNALGASWAVNTVLGMYPIAPLRRGFTVTYSDLDGAEWQVAISEDEARETLLLQMPERPPLTAAERQAARDEAERIAEAKRDEARLAAAEKYRLEAPERERRRVEAAQREEAERKGIAAKIEADANAKRVAFLAWCEVAAAGDREDVRGCPPSIEVCGFSIRQRRPFNGCPHLPLRFQATSALPRAASSPSLVLACPAGRLVATVFPGLKLKAGAPHSVRVKWGESGAPTAEAWTLGPDRDFINAPDADAFAGQIGKHLRFAIEVTPEGSPAYTADFNIGADPDRADVKYMRALCGKMP